MQVANLPNPSLDARPWVVGLEPWQIDAVRRLRETLGVDGDALVRAGLTLALAAIAAVLPEEPPVVGDSL